MAGRVQAEVAYCREVGFFTAACRACAVLAVREATLDPHGLAEELGDTAALDRPGKLPRRITSQDPMWPLVRPRFDGDRVYTLDAIVVTIVGGSIRGRAVNGMDHEEAWKLYAHDFKGMQALADAILTTPCSEPFVPPVAVVVDYLGFRCLCRPQVMSVSGPAPEFVLGPLEEAATAYGSPSDLPALLRDPNATHRQAIGLLLNEWDRTHAALRVDLQRLSAELCCQGYPMALLSDLPCGSASTALLRVFSGPGGEAELHFRTPAELAPPEVQIDTKQANPNKRLRREALSQLYAPPLPPTFKGTNIRVGSRTTGLVDATTPSDVATLQEVSERVRGELPRRLLQKLGEEGPPLDSRGWTEALHGAGINIRHLGLAASAASLPAAAALHREALARAAKWLLRRALWAKLPWATLAALDPKEEAMGAVHVAASEVVALFNLILGSGRRAVQYWEEFLVPETTRRFGVPASALARRKIIPRALFHAMEHHCRVRFHKSTQRRPFFHPAYPEPLSEEDLSVFSAKYAAPLFPHLRAVKSRWADRLKLRETYGLPVPPQTERVCVDWRGFSPDVHVACARGTGWTAAITNSAKHVGEGRWDRAYEVKKLELTIARALGEAPDLVGTILQGVAVALLELSKHKGEEAKQAAIGDEGGIHAVSSTINTVAEGGGTRSADSNLLKDAIYAADAAHDMLPNLISAWWGQLASVEGEWLLERNVEAEGRLQRLRRAWERCAADQPVLLLRLEGTCARHYACEADWPAAALYTERCANIAEGAFGKTHPATVALRARLGDCWSRREDWARSAGAYQQALACAEAGGDEAAVARLSYELAKVLLNKGDLAASKPYAEQAVKMLLPKFWEHGHISGSPQAMLAVEALYFLAQVYEAISVRAWEAPADVGLPNSVRMELMDRTIRCYENFLRHLPLEPDPPTGLSRPARVIESIVRLKALMMGPGERDALEDSIEDLMLSSGFQDHGGEARGMRVLQPRSQTRAVAEAALQSQTAHRTERLEHLYEAVAREAIINSLDPSDWFDDIVRKMQEGFSGHPDPEDPAYQATLSLLDICRYFGIFARTRGAYLR